MIPSLERWPAKAKEAPSPHKVNVSWECLLLSLPFSLKFISCFPVTKLEPLTNYMEGAVRLKISIIRGGIKNLFEIEGKKELKGLI